MQGPAATNRVNDVPWWQHGKTGLDYVDYYTRCVSMGDPRDSNAGKTVLALMIAVAILSQKKP